MFARTLRPAVLGVALLLTVGPAAANAATHHPAGRPSATLELNHHAEAESCGHNCLIVHAHGFAPGERVQMRELNRPGWQRLVTADRSGRLVVRVVLAGPRGDVVTFVGLGASQPVVGGNVSVSVPRIAVYRVSPR